MNSSNYSSQIAILLCAKSASKRNDSSIYFKSVVILTYAGIFNMK